MHLGAAKSIIFNGYSRVLEYQFRPQLIGRRERLNLTNFRLIIDLGDFVNYV